MNTSNSCSASDSNQLYDANASFEFGNAFANSSHDALSSELEFLDFESDVAQQPLSLMTPENICAASTETNAQCLDLGKLANSILSTAVQDSTNMNNSSLSLLPSSSAPPSSSTTATTLTPTYRTCDVIRLVEGFNSTVEEEQPGGRCNTNHHLPRQTIELNLEALKQTFGKELKNPHQALIKAYVLGYDRKSGAKKVLGSCGEAHFFQMNGSLIAPFSNIIIMHSSHMNGGALALRFCLHDDPSGVEICHIDSYDFRTITRRGNKKRGRKSSKSSPSSPSTNLSPASTTTSTPSPTHSTSSTSNTPTPVPLQVPISSIPIQTPSVATMTTFAHAQLSPTYGFVFSEGFVKISLGRDGPSLQSLLSSTAQVQVYFGTLLASEVSVARDALFAKPPPSVASTVTVRVVIGSNEIRSTEAYWYLDPLSPQTMQIVSQLKRKSLIPRIAGIEDHECAEPEEKRRRIQTSFM